MRWVFLVIAGLFFGCANTGERSAMSSEEGKWEYVETHGTTKDSAYSKAMEWIAVNYNSAKSVIQLQDKESGKIILKGLTPFTNAYRIDDCNYTLDISIKDQKIKFTFLLGKIEPKGGNYNAGYPPASEMPVIERQFLEIKNPILASIKNAKKDDF